MTATVLVTNGEATDVTHLHVKPAVSGGNADSATIRSNAGTTLKPGAARTYTLALGAWDSPAPPFAVAVLASYRTSSGVPKIARGTVETVAPVPVDISKLAAIEVKASLATLRSGQEEPVYLLVTNKGAQRLKLEKVESMGPEFIDLTNSSKMPRWLEPGMTAVITVMAKAEDRVRTGEHQLVFRIPASSGGSEFDLVASQNTKVGIAGESEVLELFGVPSVLFLPGFLVLTMASLLWKLRWRRKEWDDAEFPLLPKEGQFWLVAVIFSIVIVTIAAKLGTDLLDLYGLKELLVVCAASIVLGAVLYWAFVSWQNSRRSKLVPDGADTPLQVLNKLAKQGLSTRRRRISYDTGTGVSRLFLLQPDSDTRPSTWASPAITYRWTEMDAELQERIQQQIDVSHDAAALAANLKVGLERKILTVSFAGQPNSPILVAKEKIGKTELAGIVEQA